MQFNNRTYITMLAKRLDAIDGIQVLNMSLPAYYGYSVGEGIIKEGKLRVDVSGTNHYRSIDLVFPNDEIFTLNPFFEELSRGHVYGTTVREVYPIDRNFIFRNITNSTYDNLDRAGRLDIIIAVLQAIAEVIFQYMTDVTDLFKLPNKDTEPIVLSMVKGSALSAEPKTSWFYTISGHTGPDFGELTGDMHFRVRSILSRIMHTALRGDVFQANNTNTLQHYVGIIFADTLDIDVIQQSTTYPVGDQPVPVSEIMSMSNNLPRFMRDDLANIYLDINSVRRYGGYDYAQCAMTGLWSRVADYSRYGLRSRNFVIQLPFLTDYISLEYLHDLVAAVKEDECNECGSCYYATRATFDELVTARLDYPQLSALFNGAEADMLDKLFHIGRDIFTDDEPDHYCYACNRGEDYDDDDDSHDHDYRYRSISDNQRERLTELAKQYNKFPHNAGNSVIFKNKETDLAIVPDMYEINSYDYSPMLTFLEGDDMEKTKLYMGIELEMDGGGEYHAKATAINSALSGNQPYSWTMSDGSLSDGIEIATMPATLDAHMNVFNYDFACDVATALDYRAHDTASAGMHVHINRNFFGDDKHIQLYRASLMALIMERNWEDFVKFSRRRYSRLEQWAKKKNIADREYTDRDVDLIVEKTKREYNNGDKYLALNMNRQKTFELRIFRGSLKAETIKATLQFVSNLAYYCKFHGLKSAQQATILDIINYKKYPELTAYWNENKDREVSQ